MRSLLSAILDADSLEAPQRDFIGHRDVITRNLARYHFIARGLQGALLEIGCGRGYGLEIVARHTNSQIGLDVSTRFLADARKGNPGANFVCGTGEAIPVAAHTFDSVVAFDVIEHAQDDRRFLTEVKRVARPGAFISISTPNRLVASGDRVRPLNPFHIREYSAPEFSDLLNANFGSVELFGQFDRHADENSSRHRLVDRIPIRWKYLVPHGLQSLLSVALRPPLRAEECQFLTDSLDKAHTFVAFCRV